LKASRSGFVRTPVFVKQFAPITDRSVPRKESQAMLKLRPLSWCLLVLAGITCSFGYLGAAAKSEKSNEDPDKQYETKVETPMIGDYTTYAGLGPVTVEGVGLVVGLNGTGGDPAPSFYRTQLMEDLKRRGVPNPNLILQSPNTALVLVRAYLPALLKKGETIDVEIRIPDSAEAKSLAGGWLMETYLTEQAMVPGRPTPLKGHAYAMAQGAVLAAGIGSDSANSPELFMRGRVLGGATVLKERELALFLRYDYRMNRNSQRIAEAIGRRFHHYDEHGIQKPMAKAKTDQKILLSVHPRYKDNYPRYLQVVRHIAFRETPVAARVRMKRLNEDLFDPEKAEQASLELEAIGNDAIPGLKQALTSPLLECRFHAAMALAYLGETDGLPALVESARNERAFRVFALAAISTIEDSDAHVALRELMSEPSPETRYGAFRALWSLDKRDPFIRGEVLGVRQNPDGEEKSRRNLGEYMLHVLETDGEPMVHTLTRTRPEIVLFGADQEFRTPMSVSAGRHIMITAQPGATTVSVARFQIGKPDERRETSMKVADVIRAADNLGATYPDIVQMLADASDQRNLPKQLAIDELPVSGRVYNRPENPSFPNVKKKKAKVGRHNLAPNLFPESEEPDSDSHRKKNSSQSNMASVPHDSTARSKSSKSGKTSSDKDKDSKERNSDEPDETGDDKPKGMFSWFGIWRKSDK
jgi:flagellar basal body P-ring protein FlgI